MHRRLDVSLESCKPAEASSMPPACASLLPIARALVQAYEAFRRVSDPNIRAMGLNPAHFDIIATLGDERGLTCKELGERTLLVKGTLSGHLDRLEINGLIARTRAEQDTRQIIVSLTPKGKAVFEATFYPHLAHLQARFDKLSAERQAMLVDLLDELTHCLMEDD